MSGIAFIAPPDSMSAHLNSARLQNAHSNEASTKPNVTASVTSISPYLPSSPRNTSQQAFGLTEIAAVSAFQSLFKTQAKIDHREALAVDHRAIITFTEKGADANDPNSFSLIFGPRNITGWRESQLVDNGLALGWDDAGVSHISAVITADDTNYASDVAGSVNVLAQASQTIQGTTGTRMTSSLLDSSASIDVHDPFQVEQKPSTPLNSVNSVASTSGNTQMQQSVEDKTQEAIVLQELAELKSRDTEVKNHEQAHATVGGQYAQVPSFTYEKGSDGQRYAVEGEVQIDVSIVANDPQATIDKMKQVYAAAMAPVEPSAADLRVAAQALQKMNDAVAQASEQRRQDLGLVSASPFQMADKPLLEKQAIQEGDAPASAAAMNRGASRYALISELGQSATIKEREIPSTQIKELAINSPINPSSSSQSAPAVLKYEQQALTLAETEAHTPAIIVAAEARAQANQTHLMTRQEQGIDFSV